MRDRETPLEKSLVTLLCYQKVKPTRKCGFFNKTLTMDDFGKCICIMKHIAYDKKLELKYGDEFLYERYKIKYNTKKKNFKRVRSTQIGDWKFIIANQKGETIYNCDEDWFKDHFDTKQFIREKKLNVLGID